MKLSTLPGSERAVALKAQNKASRVNITANNTVGAVYFWRNETSVQSVVTIRVSGTFVGTVAIQIADPEEDISTSTNWVTLESYTTPTSKLLTVTSDCNLRFKTTAYTSGTLTTSIS